jgi:hypothetical protein
MHPVAQLPPGPPQSLEQLPYPRAFKYLIYLQNAGWGARLVTVLRRAQVEVRTDNHEGLSKVPTNTVTG